MGLLKGKTEGGSGGKRGHSNMDHWMTTSEIKSATRKRRRLESKEEAATESAARHEDEPSPLKILLPLDAEEALKDLFEEASLDSVAWKRVEPSWYVRVDPELGTSAFDRFVSLLHAQNIRFERIPEKLFWSSRSDGW